MIEFDPKSGVFITSHLLQLGLFTGIGTLVIFGEQAMALFLTVSVRSLELFKFKFVSGFTVANG
jgi:hypothetical protein